MSFKEYPHIENSYQSKEIEWLLQNRPEARNIQWVVEEKINGCNMQIYVTPAGDVQFGSRNRMLPESEDHYGFKVWIQERFQVQLTALIEFSKKLKLPIRIYGEFFGPKICKGVEYGKEKRFIMFGLMVNNQMVDQHEFYNIMFQLQMMGLYILPKQVCNSLQEALDYNPRFNSEYSPTKDLAEGVVIKPFKTVIYDQHNSPIYYKNKIDEFKEKQRAPSEKVQNDPAKGILLPYWNENRLNSCYSKLGKIQFKTDIGKYMNHIMQDICVDWQKDNGDLELEPKEKGIIQSQIAKRLLQDL